MTKRLLLASTLLCFSAGAFAQLNDTANGLDVYGVTMKDSQHERMWVQFKSKNPKDLKRHEVLFPDDEYQLNIPRSGAWTPEGFVGYFATAYSFVERPLCFYKMNVNTGSYTTITDMTNGAYEDWPVIYDLEYNWHNNTLYGLAQYTDYRGWASSGIYTVDPKTGKYRNLITDIDFYALAMAIDYDGYFYFLKFYSTNDADIEGTLLEKMELGSDNQLHEVWTKHLYVEENEFLINYTNDLTFDHTSGDLYWAADDSENWQRFIRINPETGETQKLGNIGWYESVNSLYIPFSVAESRTAPAQVKDIKVNYANRGQAVSLSWTNPSTCWNRTELKNLSSIYIARDSENNIIGTIDADGEEGERSTYIDTDASQGVHTYYIIPTNASGKGVPNKYLAQAGEDTPGKVNNLSVTKVSDSRVTISWSKPIYGAHEGWYDESSLTYDIKRMPDGKQVATGLKDNSFTDEELGEYDNYYYEITSVNAQGKGLVATSESVHAGSAIKAPYYVEFNSKEAADAWTVLDTNYDGRVWEWEGENGLPTYQRMSLNSEGIDNDFLVSPKLYVEAGKTYRVSANIFMDLANTYRLQLLEGTAPNPSDLEAFASYDKIIGENDPTFISHLFEGTFVAETTGEHYIAIRSLSAAAISNVSVYNVRFEEVFDYDLAVTDVVVVPDGVKGSEMSATVTLVNRGLKTVKAADYSVEAFEVESGKVLGTQAGPRSVYVDDFDEIDIKFTPETVGKVDIAFRVISSIDRNEENNVSRAYPFTIADAGTSEWTVEITEGTIRGESSDRETRVPFDFTEEYSNFQSIYVYDAIGMSGYITRIGYRYSPINSFSGMPMSTVSLATTDSDCYTTPQDALPQALLTTVYYGPLDLDPSDGEHIVSFDFDTPFLLEEGENLVINITHEGGVKQAYPIVTESYNHHTGVYGSVRAASSAKLPLLTTGQCIEYIPHILLAISNSDGVHEVEVSPSTHPSTYYDLLGRRAKVDAKGITVSNGKKAIR